MATMMNSTHLQSARSHRGPVLGAHNELARLLEMNANLKEQAVADELLRMQQKDLLRRLALEVTHAEQRERARMAELLHDGLQQLLVAAKMRVSCPGRERLSEEDATALLEAKQLIQEAIQTSRTLTTDLRPPILYQRGLAAAIQWLAQQTKLLYQVEVTTLLDVRAEPADDDVKAFLYQGIRELIFNAVKHAGTKQIQVTLTMCKPNILRILVEDRGIGIDRLDLKRKQASNASSGLFSMEERIAAFGGSMQIESGPCAGTHIRIELPLGTLRNANLGKKRGEYLDPVTSVTTWDTACV